MYRRYMYVLQFSSIYFVRKCFHDLSLGICAPENHFVNFDGGCGYPLKLHLNNNTSYMYNVLVSLGWKTY